MMTMSPREAEPFLHHQRRRTRGPLHSSKKTDVPGLRQGGGQGSLTGAETKRVPAVLKVLVKREAVMEIKFVP